MINVKKTNTIDETHVRKQRLGKGCVSRDTIGRVTAVKAIRSFYGVHDPFLRLGEQLQVAVSELNEKVRTHNVLM